jgi:hypothetical protein
MLVVRKAGIENYTIITKTFTVRGTGLAEMVEVVS